MATCIQQLEPFLLDLETVGAVEAMLARSEVVLLSPDETGDRPSWMIGEHVLVNGMPRSALYAMLTEAEIVVPAAFEGERLFRLSREHGITIVRQQMFGVGGDA